MELRETLDYDAAPAAVFAMLCDQTWREDVCKKVHALSFTVDITTNKGTVTVRTHRTMPSDVPGAIKRVVGDEINVVQTETWSAPAADGRRTAHLLVEILGQPATMKGSVVLEPRRAGSRETITGDVRVKIPFLGKKIEPEIAKAIHNAIVMEGEAGRAYLS